MTRIVGGVFGGRRLVTPSVKTTRPTSDRVREALFGRLEHLGRLRGAVVLDLYAGSGGLAFEALSRGASFALCVEQSSQASAVIVENANALGVVGFSVQTAAVSAVLQRPAPRVFDVVLSDPPYALGAEAVSADVAALATGGWLAADSLVVVEQSVRSGPLDFGDSFEDVSFRDYGETRLWFAYTPAADE